MTQQKTFEYPHIENADNILRKLASEGIENLYEGEQKQQALVRLERELGYVKKQGSAAGYLTVRNTSDDPVIAIKDKSGKKIEEIWFPFASQKFIYRLLEFILVFLSHITGERTKVETEMRMKAKETCVHITFTKC